MATFFTDFSEYPADTGLTGWDNNAGGTSAQCHATALTGQTGPNCLYVADGQGVVCTLMPTSGNQEIVFRAWQASNVDGAAGRGPGASLAFQDGNNTHNACITGRAGFGGDVTDLNRVSGGSYTELGSIATVFDVSSSGWWLIRFRLHDGSAFMKAWLDGPEPDTWTISTTSFSLIGTYQLLLSRSSIYYVDWVGIATNGDTAPSVSWSSGGGGGDNAVFFGCNFRRSSIIVPDMRMIHPRKRIIVPWM